MSLNKNALIRYKTIDKCLQNHFRKWTLEDLIEKCTEALYEFEGKDAFVSKRTIQLDIQNMRSEKLGYNAPIEVYDKKYYRYEDKEYSISNIPLTAHDMNVLSETVEVLKHFKDFSLFSELGGLIQRLEDNVNFHTRKHTPIIHLDKNENLKGLNFLDLIYRAIQKKQCVITNYQSFKSEKKSPFVFSPYLLKEYNNRWFVIGKINTKSQIQTFALDRIKSISIDTQTPFEEINFDGNNYFKNTIGVTVLEDNFLKNIVLKFNALNAPYVLTKPLHHSQEILELTENGVLTIRIKIHLNYELERLILGFGNSVEVLKPKGLRKRIEEILSQAHKMYKKKDE